MKKQFGSVAAVVLAWVFSADSVHSQTPSSSTYDGTKLAGSWVLTSKVTLNTCSSQYVGKTGINTWTITYNSLLEKIKAVSSSKAQFIGDPPVKEGSSYKMYMYLEPDSKQVIYDLTMQSDTKFTGTLLSAIKDDDGKICVTSMNIELKKDNSDTAILKINNWQPSEDELFSAIKQAVSDKSMIKLLQKTFTKSGKLPVTAELYTLQQCANGDGCDQTSIDVIEWNKRRWIRFYNLTSLTTSETTIYEIKDGILANKCYTENYDGDYIDSCYEGYKSSPCKSLKTEWSKFPDKFHEFACSIDKNTQ